MPRGSGPMFTSSASPAAVPFFRPDLQDAILGPESPVASPRPDGVQPDSAQSQPESSQQDLGREEQLPEYTHTLGEGYMLLEQEKLTILEHMEELREYGIKFLDQLKEQFLMRMQRCREDVEEYATGTAERWRAQSRETMQLEARLIRAQTLVASLEQSVQMR